MQGRIVTPAPFVVTPAKAGVQSLTTLDSGFRRNDEGVGVTSVPTRTRRRSPHAVHRKLVRTALSPLPTRWLMPRRATREVPSRMGGGRQAVTHRSDGHRRGRCILSAGAWSLGDRWVSLRCTHPTASTLASRDGWNRRKAAPPPRIFQPKHRPGGGPPTVRGRPAPGRWPLRASVGQAQRAHADFHAGSPKLPAVSDSPAAQSSGRTPLAT